MYQPKLSGADQGPALRNKLIDYLLSKLVYSEFDTIKFTLVCIFAYKSHVSRTRSSSELANS